MPPLKITRVSGAALRAMVAAVRTPPGRVLAASTYRKELRMDEVRALDDSARAVLPRSTFPLQAREQHERPSAGLDLPARAGAPPNSLSLQHAYRQGITTPVTVVERVLRHARELAQRSPSLGPLVTYADVRALEAAKGAEQRLARGETLGPLDGIPVPIKEEIDTEGMPTRVGTAFLPMTPAAADCPAVARLRAAGAIIIGQTVMTELGMAVLGANINRVMPRNPHDPTRLAGGSSTGAGVAVSVGVSPVALGLDGGGSVRNPAAINGVFGLKPTFGRIPITGDSAAQSVGHIGPIGISTYDLAVFVEATAGFDAKDAASGVGPKLANGELVRALGRGVRGLSIGVDEKLWQGLDSDVERPLREALRALTREGAELVPIELPLAKYAMPVGFLTIALEFFATHRSRCLRHFDQLNPDLQLMVNVLSTFKSDDYLDAQRIRGVIRRETADVLRQVDVLALPTMAGTAPRASKTDYLFDSAALELISRYCYLGNLTGLPAASAPVGAAGDGLPVGLQIIGDAWDEAAVLQVLAHLERIGVAAAVRPEAFLDVLS